MERIISDIEEIKKTPVEINNIHESVLRSYHIVAYVEKMLKRGDSRESILDVIEYLKRFKLEEKKHVSPLDGSPPLSLFDPDTPINAWVVMAKSTVKTPEDLQRLLDSKHTCNERQYAALRAYYGIVDPLSPADMATHLFNLWKYTGDV